MLMALFLFLGEFLPCLFDLAYFIFPPLTNDLGNFWIRKLRVIGCHLGLVMLAIEYERCNGTRQPKGS